MKLRHWNGLNQDRGEYLCTQIFIWKFNVYPKYIVCATTAVSEEWELAVGLIIASQDHCLRNKSLMHLHNWSNFSLQRHSWCACWFLFLFFSGEDFTWQSVLFKWEKIDCTSLTTGIYPSVFFLIRKQKLFKKNNLSLLLNEACQNHLLSFFSIWILSPALLWYDNSGSLKLSVSWGNQWKIFSCPVIFLKPRLEPEVHGEPALELTVWSSISMCYF